MAWKFDFLDTNNCVQLLETPLAAIEETFEEFIKRKDIAIILINQHVSTNEHQVYVIAAYSSEISFIDC
jgi:vacuolar-type H+-ATPase subunit F/Vma7